jgi:adenylate kinase
MIEFDKYQREAIKVCLTNKYKKVFISGVAGSGKSAIINYIKKEFNKTRIDNDIVAPTNMASRNIGGKTLHVEFNIRPNENIEAKSEDEFILFDNFTFDNEDKLSKYDKVLIVDEVSMVGKNLLTKTLDKSIYTKMILFGDLEQLPPVKDTKVNYSKYVDKHIHLKNNYRATNKNVSKWIAEFRNTHKLNPNIPKFKLNMFDEDTYIIGYTNKAISKMEKKLIKYNNNTKVILFSPIIKGGEKIYDNGDTVKLLKESYYQLDIDDIASELLNDDDLDTFFAIHENINLIVFDIDDNFSEDKYPNSCIVGDYEMYKKVLDIRFKNFIKVLKKLMSKYDLSKKEIWQRYKKKTLNIEDEKLLANVYKKYMSIKYKPFARHKNFITSYKAQGKSYKKVVVLKDDIVNDDNMYVAISRAIEELYIY